MPEPANAPVPEDAPDGRPLVTLFVMAYRQESLVREAIAGAFAQTYEPLEIVLSDDRSPDGTYAAMEEMAAAYDGPHRVILNRNPENLGIARHIDRIMELSSGRLVVQNAGDDVSLPRRVERLAEAWIASGGRAKLLHTPAIMVDETGAERGVKDPHGALAADPSPFGLISRNVYVLGAATAWDRDLFDAFGPLGPDIGVEDSVLPVRAAILGEIALVDEPLLKWRVGGASFAWRHEIRAWDYMFGARLRDLRWRAQSQRRIQIDLAHPAAAALADRRRCLETSRRQQERLEFEVAAADAGAAGRLALLPRALRLSRAHGDGFFVKQLLKYLLNPVYMRYMDRRYPPERLRW